MTGDQEQAAVPNEGRALDRSDLYERVWSDPLSVVATDIGISRHRVAKLCEQHQVPLPPPGYWAKKRAGKPVRRRALPKARTGVAESIEIEVAVREIGRVDQGPSFDPDVTAAIVQLKELGVIEVGASGDKIHRLVRCVEIDVRPQFRDRARRLADAIIRTMQHLGFKWRATSEKRGEVAALEVLGDEFSYRIRERFRTRPFDAARDENPGYFTPRTITEPRGLLVIERRCEDRYDAARSAEEHFGDLDGRVGRVVLATIKAVQANRELREQRRRWKEERDREAAVRREEAEALRLREARKRGLLEMAAKSEEAARIRRFLATCRAELKEDDPRRDDVVGWLAWGDEFAAELDPLADGVACAWEAVWQLS